MASITTATSGLSTATSTWVGGVVPVVGDKVTIATGHTVTVAGTHTWGDDTASGITVLGTLKASRAVSSTLTARGDLVISTGGTLDYGTELDPIPEAVTATIVLNDSATMAHNKWGLVCADAVNWAGFRMWGADKNPRSSIAAALSTDTTFMVADATGWKVGDTLVFGLSAAENTINGCRWRAITGISGGPLNALVTVGASLSYASQSGRAVANLTRNVKVLGSVGNTWRTHISVRVSNNFNSTNAIEIGPCELRLNGGGSSTYQHTAALNIDYRGGSNAVAAVKRLYRPVLHEVWAVSGSSVTPIASGGVALMTFFGNQAAPYIAEEPLLSSQHGINAINFYSGTTTVVKNAAVFKCGATVSGGFSQGPVAAAIDGGYFNGCSTPLVGSGVAVSFKNATFDGLSFFGQNLIAFGTANFEGCNLGGSFGFYGANHLLTSLGNYAQFTFDDCIVHQTLAVVRATAALSGVSANYGVTFRNRNNDPTQQARYSRGGLTSRDNSTVFRGLSSLAMSSWYAGTPLVHTATVDAAAGATVRIVGYARFNPTHGTTTPPTLQVSGLGITPVLFTCPAVADTWHPIDVEVTNPQAYPGTFTLTFTAQSASNSQSAQVWFDGIAVGPFVTAVRHFGFTDAPSSIAQTVDPRITLTEAAALALPVVIDHDAETITVTGTLTNREVFEACMADLCQTDNQGRAIHISSVLGDDFSTTYTVLGSVTGLFTDAAGRHVQITAPGLVAGSRVQLFNITTGTEVLNAVLAADGLQQAAVWQADATVRLRAEHATKLPLQTLGVLTSSGLAYLDVQSDDTVYSGNGIDGATVTEFTPDGPNVQVDINDPDGVTSVQRLYAWMQHYQTTQAGIASTFFGAVSAIDSASYIIDQALADIHLDNVGTTPVRVVGGYLSRRDGSTIIAATSGSIQMDPGRAYVAPVAAGLATAAQVSAVAAALPAAVRADLQAAVLPVNVARVNGLAVDGTGTEADPWGPAA